MRQEAGLLTAEEVGTMFRVSPGTVSRWGTTGRLLSSRTLGGIRRYYAVETAALLRGNSPSRSGNACSGPGKGRAVADREGRRSVDPAVLRTELEGLVPLWVLEVRSWPPWRLAAEGDEAGRIIAAGGDVLFNAPDDPGPAEMRRPAPHVMPPELAGAGPGQAEYTMPRTTTVMYRNYRRGEILNALAKGLAIGSLVPGGVTFMGRHWCGAPHQGCPRKAAE